MTTLGYALRRLGVSILLLLLLTFLTFSPWLTILPSAAIFLTVLALTLFGEGLREAFDPRGAR